MKISDLRNDIRQLSQPLLEKQGYVETGQLGEHIKITEQGDKHAILFEEIRDKASFSISIRAYVYYTEIEAVFNSIGNEFPYTLTKTLSFGSVPIQNYEKSITSDILEKMILQDAEDFFSQYGLTSLIVENLRSTDYTSWVTADRVTLFKVKLASAIIERDSAALLGAIDSAKKYMSQPWSLPDRDHINELCIHAQTSI